MVKSTILHMLVNLWCSPVCFVYLMFFCQSGFLLQRFDFTYCQKSVGQEFFTASDRLLTICIVNFHLLHWPSFLLSPSLACQSVCLPFCLFVWVLVFFSFPHPFFTLMSPDIWIDTFLCIVNLVGFCNILIQCIIIICYVLFVSMMIIIIFCILDIDGLGPKYTSEKDSIACGHWSLLFSLIVKLQYTSSRGTAKLHIDIHTLGDTSRFKFV